MAKAEPAPRKAFSSKLLQMKFMHKRSVPDTAPEAAEQVGALSNKRFGTGLPNMRLMDLLTRSLQRCPSRRRICSPSGTILFGLLGRLRSLQHSAGSFK